VSLDLPTTAVQAIVDAMPRALIPKLDGLTVRGTLAWPLRITLDSVDIDGIEIVSKPVLSGFRVVTMGKSIDFDRLKSAFKYTIRGVDGEPARRRSGPLTGRFAALEEITPYMAKAVTTTEDGSFYTHDGISTFAIRESIITNLRQGKFSRGASTLTQQLVKNLYLGPDKTVSRKLQELFIARQIEEALSKEELIALYLNIIEWGPGIYGIVEASEHYFGKAPAELTALQAIFLSSIIPNPRRYHGFFDAGQVSPRWRNYLRVLLGVMVQRNKISLAEQEAAFPYDPVFRGQERVSPTPVPQDVPPPDYQPPPLDEAPQ
jgi:membrane peptidoglycan carboxypeptidase